MRVVGVDAEIDRDVLVGQCARVMNAVLSVTFGCDMAECEPPHSTCGLSCHTFE